METGCGSVVRPCPRSRFWCANLLRGAHRKERHTLEENPKVDPFGRTRGLFHGLVGNTQESVSEGLTLCRVRSAFHRVTQCKVNGSDPFPTPLEGETRKSGSRHVMIPNLDRSRPRSRRKRRKRESSTWVALLVSPPQGKEVYSLSRRGETFSGLPQRDSNKGRSSLRETPEGVFQCHLRVCTSWISSTGCRPNLEKESPSLHALVGGQEPDTPVIPHRCDSSLCRQDCPRERVFNLHRLCARISSAWKGKLNNRPLEKGCTHHQRATATPL